MLSSFAMSQGKGPKTKRISLLLVDVRPEVHPRNGCADLEASGRDRRKAHQI